MISLRLFTRFSLLLILGCMFFHPAFAQIVAPESGVWDTAHSRYLFSCAGNGTIVARTVGGQTSVWATGLTQPKGMALLGDTLYVTDVTIVRAYNLNTAQSLFTMTFPAASFLNDIAVDSEYIFVSDMQVNAIYRANVGSRAGSPYCVGNVQAPNGIWIDHPNNRVLFVSFRVNSPIQAVSRTESGSATTVRATTLSELDGFTCDRWGRFYVSSWTTNTVYQISLQENTVPVVIANNINGPADMFIGSDDTTLVVPAMNVNQIRFLGLAEPLFGNIVLPEPFHNYGPSLPTVAYPWSMPIVNDGRGDLRIDSVVTHTANFYPEAFPSLTLAPNDTIQVVVFCRLQQPEGASDTVFIYSNDPDSPVVHVALSAEFTAIPEHSLYPNGFAISPLYPNPFNAEAKLRVNLAQSTHLQISLHNLLGHSLQNIEDRNVTPGVYDYSLSSQSLANGVYFVQIRGNGRPIATYKAVVLK